MVMLKFRTSKNQAWQLEDAERIWYDKINLDVDYNGSASEYNKLKMEVRETTDLESKSL